MLLDTLRWFFKKADNFEREKSWRVGEERLQEQNA